MTRKKSEKHAYDSQGKLITTYRYKLAKSKSLSEIDKLKKEFSEQEKKLRLSNPVGLTPYHQEDIRSKKKALQVEVKSYTTFVKLEPELFTYFSPIGTCKNLEQLNELMKKFNDLCEQEQAALIPDHTAKITEIKEKFVSHCNVQRAKIEHLKPYEDLLARLKTKAENLNARNCNDAYKMASALHTELFTLAEGYKTGKKDQQQFKNESTIALKNAEPLLKVHRGKINHWLIPFLVRLSHLLETMLEYLHCKAKSKKADPTFFAKPSRIFSTDSFRNVLWPLNQKLDSLFPSSQDEDPQSKGSDENSKMRPTV